MTSARELGQPAGVARHAPGQRLEDEDVAVAIEDQAREEITLAEDEADGVAVVAEAPAEGPAASSRRRKKASSTASSRRVTSRHTIWGRGL